MASLQSEIKSIENRYGPDHLNLTLARGYLKSLLANDKVAAYLVKHHSEISNEFRKMTDMDSVGEDEAQVDPVH